MMSEEYSIFTLEERKDGWDDVRAAIRERQKPWNALTARLTEWYQR